MFTHSKTPTKRVPEWVIDATKQSGRAAERVQYRERVGNWSMNTLLSEYAAASRSTGEHRALWDHAIMSGNTKEAQQHMEEWEHVDWEANQCRAEIVKRLMAVSTVR